MSTSPPDRPDWDTFFMALAFLVAQRSPDAETKHGAVVVDENRRILGMGFNGFPRGCRDEKLPTIRPGKYPYMVHAELNALINARSIPDPARSAIYITGEPCNECFKAIIQFGIGRVVHGSVGSTCINTNEEHDMVRSSIAEGLSVVVDRYTGPVGQVAAVLEKTAAYVLQRG